VPDVYAVGDNLQMSTGKINLNEQTATSTNGITFKLTERMENMRACAWIPRIFHLMIWMMWYWAEWLKRLACFIRWSWIDY